MCPHVTCLLAYEWDPKNDCVPKSLRTAEDYISSKIGAVMKEGGPPDFTNKDSDRNSVYQINYISAMTSRMTGSVKVALIPSMNVSETNNIVQDVPQTKTFQSKGRQSTVSPEELSERW